MAAGRAGQFKARSDNQNPTRPQPNCRQIGSRTLKTMEVPEIVSLIGMIPHREGGYFKETYRNKSFPVVSTPDREECSSPTVLSGSDGEHALSELATLSSTRVRNVCTSILYCLTKGNFIGVDMISMPEFIKCPEPMLHSWSMLDLFLSHAHSLVSFVDLVLL